MNKVWVITPTLEQRKEALPRLVAFLRDLKDVRVLGHGRNGITISVPLKYNVRQNLPQHDAHTCIIEEAEVPVLMGNLRPRMRG
jgi:hypothetical protein